MRLALMQLLTTSLVSRGALVSRAALRAAPRAVPRLRTLSTQMVEQQPTTQTADVSAAADQLLQLQVSSPALLLNHMAERYLSTSRILMEFVDNALDDAEALYDGEADAYLRPVTVDVHVSRAQGSLRIVDNCRGMAPDVLSRVVMRVGESRKRGASFVNGQFGFGMQARRRNSLLRDSALRNSLTAPPPAAGLPRGVRAPHRPLEGGRRQRRRPPNYSRA